MTSDGPGQTETNPRDAIPVSLVELVGVLAMMSATVAFAIDAMLPAFPLIAAELSADAPNRVQLIVATFMMGLGLGTLVVGPLSDAYGRQTVAIWGTALIVICALVSAVAPSLEVLLVARFVQGLGSAGPRVAAMAIVRDLFRGREMAKIMSFVIFVFTLAPIFAPSIGWALSWAFGWHAIFVSFAVFSLVSTGWLVRRLPETLRPENTRPFNLRKLFSGVKEIFSIRHVVLTMMAQTLVFAILMSALMSSQQVFHEVFDQGARFHLWFGLMAILAAGSNLVNASLVMRFGMKTMVKWALIGQGALTFVFLVALVTGSLPAGWLFPVGFIWYTSVFYLAGFGIGNLASLAMEPLGHMAGLAASIVAAIPTVVSMAIAVPVGQAFNGTMIPLTTSVLLLGAVALLLIMRLADSEA